MSASGQRVLERAEAAPRPARRPGGKAVSTPWWRDPARAGKPFVFAAALYPLGRLLWGLFMDPDLLGANPAETIEHVTGDWTMHFLLLTLAVSPLRRLSGLGWLIRYRRMLGLFVFFYGVLHLSSYLAFDMVFDPAAIARDIVKRPFITVGFGALMLMLPLAITSTRGWVLRLGGPRWASLHRLVYAVLVLGVLHYWWLVKRDLTWPIIYAALAALLLGWRVWMRYRPRPAKTRRAAA
jgi:sulfoxide reductase heme-binding subunit YedZ